MTLKLEEVVGELKRSRNESTPVPESRVLNWMRNADADADTLGAIYVFLSKTEHIQRVVPPLSFDSVFDFMLRYYEFCLKSNPDSKWANNSYSAGWDLAGWFVSMWREKRDRRYFSSIKSMLCRLYCEGDPKLKKCIEQAIVRHLFELKDIKIFFDDWRNDQQLRAAYDEGRQWAERGGASPLTEPQ